MLLFFYIMVPNLCEGSVVMFFVCRLTRQCTNFSRKLFAVLSLFAFASFFGVGFACDTQTVAVDTQWNVIAKDKSVYRILETNLAELQCKTGKSVSEDELQASIDEFNLSVDTELNLVLKGLSKFMTPKDVKATGKILRKMIKTLVKAYVPNAMNILANDGVINLEETARSAVRTAFRNMILRN